MKLAALVFFTCFASWAAPPIVTVTQNAASVGRYDIYELTMANPASYANPWEDPLIIAVFMAPSGTNYTVSGFYYDGQIWKLRFAPREVGGWTWTLSYSDKNGAFSTNGVFACTNSSNTGPLRIHPCNNYRFMTEAASNVFYPISAYYYYPSTSYTNVSQQVYSDSADGQPITIDDFLLTRKNAGQNMTRLNTAVDNLALINTFNSGGTGKNTYLLTNGMFLDSYMAALHRVDWKCDMVFWGSAKSGYDLSNPAVSNACMNYHQYVINRYSAYVDLWELLNEASGIPPTYSEPVSAYIRGHDPYRHLITPCFAQADQTNFDVITPHDYQSSANVALAATVAGDVTGSQKYTNTATGYREPVYIGEFGGTAYTGAYSPERYRLALWASWFARGAFNATDMGSRTEFGNTSGGINNLNIDSKGRAESKIFSDFIANFDPSAQPVAITLAPVSKLNGYGLSSPTDLGLYLLHADNQNAVLSGATVQVTVPTNNMQGQWIDPATGVLLQQPLTLNAGLQTIPIPAFKDDVVFRAHAGGPAQTLQFSTSSYRVNSDQSGVVLTLYRLGGGSGSATVDYATSDSLAKASFNYMAVAGTIGWGPNDVGAKTITIPLINTGVLQADKDFVVGLSNPTGGAVLGGVNRTVVTVVNGVTNTVVFAPTYAVTNGAGTLAISVNRIGNGSGPLTIYYSTRGGVGAVAGTDYVAIPMSTYTMTWPDGDLSPKSFTVNILNNASSTSNKTFAVALSDGGSPLVVGSAPPDCRRAIVVIQANPALSPGVLQFSGNNGYASLSYGWFGADYVVAGTNASALLPVSRVYGSNGTVSVNYTTTAAAGTAAAGVDYTTVSGTLTWTNGDTADKVITVPLVHNSASSGNLTFWLALSNPTGGAILGENAARLTILDPATVLPPQIVVQPLGQTVNSGQQATFTVVASGTPAPSYQWQFNGTNIVGATNAIYTIAVASATNTGSYTVIISNSAGTVITGGVQLTVTPFQITHLVFQTNGVLLTWTTTGGQTNVVQSTSDLAIAFTNLSPDMVIPGNDATTANYLDPGGATNRPTRFYRIRLAP